MTKEEIFKMLEGRIDTITNLSIECMEMMYNAGYNDGIEAAAKNMDDMGEEARICEYVREMKK